MVMMCTPKAPQTQMRSLPLQNKDTVPLNVTAKDMNLASSFQLSTMQLCSGICDESKAITMSSVASCL